MSEIMKRKVFFSVLFGLLGISVACAVTSAFAQTATIMLTPKQGDVGPYYRLRLPTSLYPNSISPLLSELRVRNAAGDFLPYGWVNDELKSAPIISSHHALFPLHEDSQKNDQWRVDVVRNTDGSLTQMTQQKSTNTSKKIIAWLIDVSQIKASSRLLQARFTLKAPTDGIATLRLESSDDLQQWSTVSDHEQLIKLEYQGALIQNLDLNLRQISAKYLRLRWHDTAKTALLESVTIDSQEQAFTEPALDWSAPIIATNCDKNSCEYTMPRNTPIDSLRIQLGETNTLAHIEVIGKINLPPNTYHRHHRNPLYVLRHQKKMSEQPSTQDFFLADTVAYRLQLANGEATSDELAINGLPYQSIRIQTKGAISALGHMPPTIQIGTVPRTIVFLARGKAPFRLEWGSANSDTKAEGAAISLSTLFPNSTLQQIATIAEAQLETIKINAEKENSVAMQKATPTTKEKSHNKPWLWAALLIGLALLGAMVWSLLGSLNKAKEEEGSET